MTITAIRTVQRELIIALVSGKSEDQAVEAVALSLGLAVEAVREVAAAAVMEVSP